jgi:hypothetical protein
MQLPDSVHKPLWDLIYAARAQRHFELEYDALRAAILAAIAERAAEFAAEEVANALRVERHYAAAALEAAERRLSADAGEEATR